MEKITRYREIIKNIINAHVYPSNQKIDEFEAQVVMDEPRDHYYLMKIGWDGQKRLHGCTLHFDIKNGKIWIQEDWTEEGVIDELLNAGVPPEDIVPSFRSPEVRKHLGLAVS
jgi:hypothetical protein